MASKPICLLTARDLDLFQALDRCPLTVRQILKLSTTFAYPFTDERRVQERLYDLRAAGRVRQWWYTTAGPGALGYYTLTPLSYRLLHGLDAARPGRGLFSQVAVARQAHTQALAEVLVHLFVAAHAAGIHVENVSRENTVCLRLDDDSQFPDGKFELVIEQEHDTEEEPRFTFFIEIDNRTEPIVRSGTAQDSWKRKVEFYERYQDVQPERFRVLAVTTGGPERLDHMLRCAAHLAKNPERSLIYGITLQDLLNVGDAVTSNCFRNHTGMPVALVPPKATIRDVSRWASGKSQDVLLPSAACLRPSHAV